MEMADWKTELSLKTQTYTAGSPREDGEGGLVPGGRRELQGETEEDVSHSSGSPAA